MFTSVIIWALSLAIFGRGIWAGRTFTAALGFVMGAFMTYPTTAALIVYGVRLAGWRVGIHGL